MTITYPGGGDQVLLDECHANHSGICTGTMLSKRDAQFGRGRPVAPDTFIRGSDPKAHLHYYCDLAGLAALFAGFELLSLTQEEQRRRGSWHWHILAERQ